MADVRWFAENRYSSLVVPHLERAGLAVALEGDEPARLAVAMSQNVAVDAWRFASRHRCALVFYLWDLPPWRLGAGTYDPVIPIGRALLRVPRPVGGYRERREYYSRLRFVASRAREVWVPSAATEADVRERFRVDTRRVRYCYDSDRFRPAPRRVSAGGPLLSVSRLAPSKNHEAVIRLGARLGMPVRIIGPGPMREELLSRAAALGVPSTVESGLSERDVVDAYRGAALVVCASRFEGMGLSGLEAAACGVPVVASSISPHREFLGGVAHFFALDDDDDLERAARAALAAGSPPAGGVSGMAIEAAAVRFRQLIAQLLA